MNVCKIPKMAVYKERRPVRIFPMEILNMIFRLLLQGAWTDNRGQGHVKNILTALRGDPDLYKEALAIFYKTNTFCLTERNMWLRRYFIEHNGVRFMDTSVVSLTSNLIKIYLKVPLSTPLTGPINGYAYSSNILIRSSSNHPQHIKFGSANTVLAQPQKHPHSTEQPASFEWPRT